MKKFLNILPDLKLSHEMTELFETVECEKVAASRDHSRIKIYIQKGRENISGTFCSGDEGGRKLNCASENGEVEA